MKIVGAGLLAFIALFFVLAGIGALLTLPAQVADNRIYLRQFERVAAYVDVHGRLPDAKVLDTWMDQSGERSIQYMLNDQPVECDPDFAQQSSDRFVLSFWRGEWFECYAYPSGKTTMPMSVSGYLGIWYGAYWLVALVSGWGAWRLIRSWLSHRQAAGLCA